MKSKKVALIVSTLTIVMTMGVTAFAASTTDSTDDSRKSAVWEILTDEQKTQLAEDAKAKLKQELADGEITQEQYDAKLAAIENGDLPFGKYGRGGRGMNEERKAQMDAMNEKWNALTDEQKAEIYDLNDQKADIESKIIDKYSEFGVIDSDTATTMKENIETEKNDRRENGKMPMGGMGGMRGRKGAANCN